MELIVMSPLFAIVRGLGPPTAGVIFAVCGLGFFLCIEIDTLIFYDESVICYTSSPPVMIATL